MNHDEQASWLNGMVKTHIAPSPLHGVGLFALRDIEAGEKLYADFAPQVFTITYASFNKLLPDVREEILGKWPQVVNNSAFAYPTTRLQGYINHSDDPNYDAANDVMLKAVKKGEEITENYKLVPNYHEAYPWLAATVV